MSERTFSAQNRTTAMKMLKARLYEMERQKREEKATAKNALKTDTGWGHRLRSYMLQPYQLVKDLRTGIEPSQPALALEGDLEIFLAAALAVRIKGQTAEVEDSD